MTATGPDDANNVLALAFGVPIVTLVVAGLLWIMLNNNMMPARHGRATREIPR
jgi:cytochrome o ubiquinol oxidase subunit IV